MAIKHAFQSGKVDGADSSKVQASNWNADHNIDASGANFTGSSTDPTTPASGNMAQYAMDIASRKMPRFGGDDGYWTTVQPHFGFDRVGYFSVLGTGTAATSFTATNINLTASGSTYANTAPASTNRATAPRRFTITSVATAATGISSMRSGVLDLWRGNAATLGGFFVVMRWSTDSSVATTRGFFGLYDSTTNPANTDFTTSTTNAKIGVGYSFGTGVSTGNYSLIYNTAGSAPTVTSLGSNCPVNTTSLNELTLYAPPNASFIGYRMRNLSTSGITQSAGTVNTNLPAAASFMGPLLWMCNNATASAVILSVSRIYVESDD